MVVSVSKRAQSEAKEPPSQCTFCDNIAASPEHLWPRWMAKHFPRGAHDYSEEISHRFHPNPQIEPTIRRRHGHPITQAPKVVCRLCNNGWMSGLETPAKRWLEPMLLGQSVVLNTEAQRDLLHWIVLKLMVFERRPASKAAFTRESAFRFKADRTLPSNLSIDLIHTTDDRLRSVIHRESGAVPPDADPGISLISTNLQAVVFCIGQLVVYARHAQLENLNFRPFSTDFSSPLWPDPIGPLTWPPQISLTFDEIEYLKGGMGRFFANMTPV